MTALGGVMTKSKAWEVTDDFSICVEPLIPAQ